MENNLQSPFALSQQMLDECASEPIHIPGSIQPFGILLALTTSDWVIVQVSLNSASIINHEPLTLYGKPLAAILGEAQTATLRNGLVNLADGVVFTHKITLKQHPIEQSIQARVHRYHDAIVLELLPILESSTSTDTPNDLGYALLSRFYDPQVHRRLSDSLNFTLNKKLALSHSMPLSRYTEGSVREFCQHVAEQVRSITGYDRVMVYEFDAVGNGAVIAEARHESIESYLSLHYPASDIPAQARQLYLRNRVRVLGDVYAEPVAVVPRINPTTTSDLDLSYCLLRSFSPIHLEYLHNMGVRATLTVSIIRDGALWGLIACHHYQPRWISHEVQLACDLLSEIISVQLTIHENYVRARAEAYSHRLQHKFMQMIVGQGDWVATMLDPANQILTLIEADGIAIHVGNQIHTMGITPPLERIQALVKWLVRQHPQKLFVTDRLSQVADDFADIKGGASGLLAIEIGYNESTYVVWFRRELKQTVAWGGNPNKGIESTSQGERLRPRTSFAAWEVAVHGQSKPWIEEELFIAEAVRSSIVDILMEMLSVKNMVAELELLRIRKAVESSSEPIVVANASGSVIFLNRAFANLFGYDAQSLNKRGGLQSLFADPQMAIQKSFALQSLTGAWQGEVDLLHLRQELIRVDLRADSLRNEHGETVGYVYLCTDLRARIKAEADHRKLETHLQHTQKLESLGLLAGGIAHDFNNLLTSILGNASLALLELPTGSSVQESIQQIELAAHRAADLCRQMLAYSGKGKFVIQTLDLNLLIEEMAVLLMTVISKTVVLRFNLALQPLHVVGDATQIRQIVMNLIINASDAIGAYNGVITIKTSSQLVDDLTLDVLGTSTPLKLGYYGVLQISDTGSGMDSATMMRIFDPFFTTKATGRGLGLAAVQGIVNSHEGLIHVNSQIGRGTTFTMMLPLSNKTDEQPAPLMSQVAAFGAGRTILVVDDDQNVQRFTRRALERIGFTVLIAQDGAVALNIFQEHKAAIAAVLLDLTMPKMGGVEAFKLLRLQRADLPILLSSGYTEEVVHTAFSNSSAVHFIHKPYKVGDLYAALGRVLAQ